MTAADLKAYLEQAIRAHPACRHVRVQIDVHRPRGKATACRWMDVRILGTNGPVDPEACEDAIRTIIARARKGLSASATADRSAP